MKRIEQSLLIILSLALVITGCKPKEEQQEIQREEVVETTILKSVEVARELNLSSTLQGYTTQNIAPSVTGIIQKIYVLAGDEVKKGALLVQMDPQQYNTAKLSYENLKTECARMEALVSTGAVSQQAYDQAKMGLNQAAEQIRFLEQNTFVRAEFDGVITAKNYENGELYAGQYILSMSEIKTLKLMVNVPEAYFPMIKNGMQVALKSDVYPSQTFTGVVDQIFPVIDPSSHTFSVRVKINNPSKLLRPGMYCHAIISLESDNAMLVPYQCVQRLTGSNERYVYLNDNGKAKRVFVKLGDRYDDRVEIIADQIKEGVEIVTTGAEKLVDGVAIKVVKVY
ncbi:MAG: efflux RND transporter periplasmic adaptor subunit [Bacteroidales bacterium]|nr:efflux RND transporter periplasmic adaptor subunit [Bacteroidales bacterium]